MLNKLSNFITIFNSNNWLFKINVILYSLLKLIVKPFQNVFVELYSVNIQLDRVSFQTIPSTAKIFIIYISTNELWHTFFKRIKNSNNFFTIREKNNSITQRFWCLFYKSNISYFNETNIKFKSSKVISNFYYVVKLTKSNLILFYFFNKIILTNYPYFYWKYVDLYNNYDKYTHITDVSQNNKSILFFMYIDVIKNKFKNKKNFSFVKASLVNFTGVRNTLKNASNFLNIEVVLSKLQSDNLNMRIQNNFQNLFERNSLKEYNVGNSKTKLNLNFIFYINNIIYKNVNNIIENNSKKIYNKLKFIKIIWYNKIHNSILQTTKINIILFLRSSKHFNKGRYSRNRQIYRTGVYWCIWLNVVIVYALHYYFYRIVFSFGYIWLPLGFMILVMFSSRLYKYRFYEITQLIIEIKEYNNLLYFIYLNIIIWFRKLFNNAQNKFANFSSKYIYLITNIFFVENK